MIIWVAVGGGGTLIGAVIGAIGVNWLQSVLTTTYPDLWLLVLGSLFVGVVLFFPDGVVGGVRRAVGWLGAAVGRRVPAEAPGVVAHPETR
jgi:ABC-type branched-subunit amino acid transport system permease subunit